MKIILFTETAKVLNTYASLFFCSLAKCFLKGFSTKDRKWNPKSSYTLPYIIASLRAPQSKGLICRNLGYWLILYPLSFATSHVIAPSLSLFRSAKYPYPYPWPYPVWHVLAEKARAIRVHRTKLGVFD